MKKILALISMAAVALMVCSCDEKPGSKEEPITLSCVSTGQRTFSFEVCANVPDDGNKYYMGVLIGDTDPTVDPWNSNSKSTNYLPAGVQLTQFDFDDFEPGQTYLVCAFLCNASQSNTLTFTKLEEFTTLNLDTMQGHPFVDLGLSVCWADCNMGAETRFDTGDFYAWGECAPYYDGTFGNFKKGKEKGYDWDSYSFCQGSEHTLTEYVPKDKAAQYGALGYYDTATTLREEDDAPRNWGAGWSMPTQADWQELLDNCTFTVITKDGTKYVRAQSKVEGYTSNYIIIPLAPYVYSTNASSTPFGYYWSSTLDVTEPSKAISCIFDSNKPFLREVTRCYGQLIRPVLR